MEGERARVSEWQRQRASDLTSTVWQHTHTHARTHAHKAETKKIDGLGPNPE